MAVVKVGAEVAALTEVTQLITEIALPIWSAAVLIVASPAAAAVIVVVALTIVVKVVVDGWVSVLLHHFFGDWLHPTSCAVTSAVVGSAMPGSAPSAG